MTAIALSDSRSRSWRQVRGRFGRNLKVRIGLGLLTVFVALPVMHPILQATVWADRPNIYHPEVGFDPLITHPSGPTSDHLLGTDPLGRDVLSMVSKSITPSLIVAFSTALVVAITSMLVGASTAYFGRRVDSVLTQLASILVLIPAPIMFLVIGKGRPDYGVFELGMVYGLFFGLGPAALVVRSRALSVMQRPFIEAARAAGGSGRYIITNHLAPHLIPHVATQVLVAVTGAMITEGFIELLGAAETRLGMGSLVYLALAYRTALQSAVPWSTLLTGALAISLLSAAFFLLSVGIQEAADPKRIQHKPAGAPG